MINTLSLEFKRRGERLALRGGGHRLYEAEAWHAKAGELLRLVAM